MSAGSGIEWMVDAMEHLQGLDVRYVVTGPGIEEQSRDEPERYRHMLEQRSWLHGVASRITFEPDDDDQTALTEQLAQATAVIVPADVARELPDGFADEILAAGVPIIATDLAGLREVRRVGGGLFVPPHDAGALADAVVRIMIDPHLGAAMVVERPPLCPAPARRASGPSSTASPTRSSGTDRSSVPDVLLSLARSTRCGRVPVSTSISSRISLTPAGRRPPGPCSTSAPTARGRARRRR